MDKIGPSHARSTLRNTATPLPPSDHLLPSPGYRYPRGESYFDILSRLDPLVHEMESYHEPVLIVSHQAVLRVRYA